MTSVRTRGNSSLNDGNLEVGALLGKHVGGTEAARASAHNDDVTLGILVKVCKVAASHSTGDLGLSDMGELEVLPSAGHVPQSLGGTIERGDDLSLCWEELSLRHKGLSLGMY